VYPTVASSIPSRNLAKMLPSRSRPVIAQTACLAGLAFTKPQPARTRALSQLTMGFEDIAKWKAEKRKRANPNYHTEQKTIFDINIDTPSHKSSAWNISYAPDPPVMKPAPAAPTSASQRTSPDRKGQTRNYRASSPIVLSLATTQARAEIRPFTQIQPVRITQESAALYHQESVFGAERSASQIPDVPSLDVLSRLRTVDAESQAAPPVPQPPAILLPGEVKFKPTNFGGLFSRLGELLALMNSSKGGSKGGNSGSMPQQAHIGLGDIFGTPENKTKPDDVGIDMPKVPGQPPAVDTLEARHGTHISEVKSELPMFLGGGPF